MSRLRLVPVSFRDACGFVAMHHRHHQPPVGCNGLYVPPAEVVDQVGRLESA